MDSHFHAVRVLYPIPGSDILDNMRYNIPGGMIMNLSAISHRSAFTDCYALDRETAVLNLRTGKDITAVNLIYEDPYAHGISGDIRWVGISLAMDMARELKDNYIWSAQVKPPYRRLQYYFEIFCGEEKLLMFEDGFYTEETIGKPGRWKQYFKLPYLNPCDVITPPSWVEGTVWYQIMSDRFCRGSHGPKRVPLKDWNDRETVTGFDFYGGDLRGIIEKLPYLQELGITGIYLLPVFLSNSNHKYNTSDYETIDPDFGTEEDMVELVEKAHALGIRVMVDAVFNHSGTEFFAWKDVWEKGEGSRYFDWFCIHKLPFERKRASLRDGRFDGFAFIDSMPKLNTGNPEVVDYCIARCRHWVKDWHVDGIRFDVGNEVSHQFLKAVNAALKPLNPELFLLGEIWHDSIQWLQGDEYDSVMNYPFFESLHNFWVDEDSTSRDLMYAMNRVYSLYPEQVNRCIFNFLDTHDTLRALNRCGSLDVFYQQLAVLMTMPGTACVYYGTEIAMPGGHDPDCRRTMPWDEIAAGDHADAMAELKKLIALRKNCPATRGAQIQWQPDPANPRLVCYHRVFGSQQLRVCLNASQAGIPLTANAPLYARHYRDGILHPGGILIESLPSGQQ